MHFSIETGSEDWLRHSTVNGDVHTDTQAAMQTRDEGVCPYSPSSREERRKRMLITTCPVN
jgi:hypothetical protein